MADVFDAMTSDRVYRHSLSDEAARKFIVDGTGVLFCPTCVEAFLKWYDGFKGGGGKTC